jgi:hypothetical protein
MKNYQMGKKLYLLMHLCFLLLDQNPKLNLRESII